MSREEIAAILKRLRVSSGMTAEQVGERLGKSGKTVSAWENCHGQPDIDTFFDLMRLYRIIDSPVDSAGGLLEALRFRSERDREILRRYWNAAQPTRAAVDALLQTVEMPGENRRVIAAFGGGLYEHTFFATDQEISDAIKEDEMSDE